jgi:hypothetical protein
MVLAIYARTCPKHTSIFDDGARPATHNVVATHDSPNKYRYKCSTVKSCNHPIYQALLPWLVDNLKERNRERGLGQRSSDHQEDRSDIHQMYQPVIEVGIDVVDAFRNTKGCCDDGN